MKVLILSSVASMIYQFNMSNIRLLQQMGYEVHVACNFENGNTCDEVCLMRLKGMLHQMKVTWFQWDCPRDLYAFHKCVKAYVQLWRITGRYPYRMIHCQSPIGGALARLVAHLRGISVIYTAHGFHFYKGAPLKNWLLYYPVEKLLAYWTDVLITVNKEDYAFARRNLAAEKIYRIPGVGIDVDAYHQPVSETDLKMRRAFREKYRIPQDAIVLLSVGELNEGKNHRMALEALAGMKRKDVYYLICGQGKLQVWLRRYAGRLGIAEQIRLPGYVGEIGTAYLASDIFIFPSKREGMPVALMEAMAGGMPCVVSDIRGNRELVEDSQRRFCLNRPSELMHILQEFIGDSELRKRCGASNRIHVQSYNRITVEQHMKKIYRGQLATGENYEKNIDNCGSIVQHGSLY